MYVYKTTDSAVLPFYDISSFQKKITWFLTLFNLINNHTFYSINKPNYARSGQFKKQTNICIIKKEVMLVELYVFSTFNTYSIYAKMTLYSTYIF